MKPVLLFDLDGTLTDSRVGIVRCFQFALEKAGERVPQADELGFVLGPPLAASFRRLGIAEERVETLILYYRERYVPVGIWENTVYSGIPEMLERLKAAGYRLFVATSKAQVFARQITAHFQLDRHFEKVYGSELDGTRANKGELIAHILASENIVSAVMVGDREHDIHGAKTNGLSTVGVLWGYGSRQELIASGADRLADTPDHLTRLYLGRPKWLHCASGTFSGPDE